MEYIKHTMKQGCVVFDVLEIICYCERMNSNNHQEKVSLTLAKLLLLLYNQG